MNNGGRGGNCKDPLNCIRCRVWFHIMGETFINVPGNIQCHWGLRSSFLGVCQVLWINCNYSPNLKLISHSWDFQTDLLSPPYLIPPPSPFPPWNPPLIWVVSTPKPVSPVNLHVRWFWFFNINIHLGGPMIKEIINDTRWNICMLVKLRILKIIHNPVRFEGVPQIMSHTHLWVCITISIFHPDPSFYDILRS